MSGPAHSPVFIGGVGGSGTGLVANLLRTSGWHIGSDLNGANDILWYALFFMRREILQCPEAGFSRLVNLYSKGFTGGNIDGGELALLKSLVDTPRPAREKTWLIKRAEKFIEACAAPAGNPKWGWKAPNTHIIAPRLLKLWPQAKYIHVWRDGLDMAFSSNQNQRNFWGQHYSGGPYGISPSGSLDFWCAVHRNMLALKTQYPDRMLFLNFDELCECPDLALIKFSQFIGSDKGARDLEKLVRPPKSIGRGHRADQSQFNDKSLNFANGFLKTCSSF